MLHREPLYLEQLIPAAMLIDYDIQSKTPLSTKPKLYMRQ